MLTVAHIVKIWNFGIHLPIIGISLDRFLIQNLARGDRVPCLHPLTKFHHWGFRNVGLLPRKMSKLRIFGIHLPLRGDAILQKFVWGRKSRVLTLTPNFIVVALEMWAYCSYDRQNW